MNIKQQIEDYLSRVKKQTVLLSELESLCPGFSCSYQELAEVILELEEGQVLKMVKTQGRNGKRPSLAYQYRVNKSNLNQDLHKELQLAKLELHPLIQLDAYYSLPRIIWLEDKPLIERIDAYLRQHPLPSESVPAPERSFVLVGDEKWITERGGEKLLERIGLWEQMKIISVADPLMLAFNPQYIGRAIHLHLIVENKSAYQGLIQALPESPFTTLIYGCGKKIIRSIELFPLQLPLPKAEHRFYYFGDIDHEGITIWHLLNERAKTLFQTQVQPALPFYRACLAKNYVYGKETHRKDEQAMASFLSCFSESDRQRVQACLCDGGYYPQEILKSSELQELWRTASWTT